MEAAIPRTSECSFLQRVRCFLFGGMTAVLLFSVLPVSPAEAAGESAVSPEAARRITPPRRPLNRPEKTPGNSPKASLAASFWKTVSVLGVLVAVLLIGGRLLRKHAPKLAGGLPNEVFEVLGKRTIDRGQLIYLVRLGSRILIIGSSTGGLQTLAEITDPVEIDYLAGLCRPSQHSAAVSQGFLALFQRNTAVATPPAAERYESPAEQSAADIPQHSGFPGSGYPGPEGSADPLLSSQAEEDVTQSALFGSENTGPFSSTEHQSHPV